MVNDSAPEHEITKTLLAILGKKFGESLAGFIIPPPVFTFMEGEFIAFHQEQGWLKARFPIKQNYLNPYQVMQGGMIAAAIDNTLGPLSMLVAPPNVTRALEIKYSAPVSPALRFIVVEARLVERKDRELSFKFEVRSEEQQLLARGRAKHWITTTE